MEREPEREPESEPVRERERESKRKKEKGVRELHKKTEACIFAFLDDKNLFSPATEKMSGVSLSREKGQMMFFDEKQR